MIHHSETACSMDSPLNNAFDLLSDNEFRIVFKTNNTRFGPYRLCLYLLLGLNLLRLYLLILYLLILNLLILNLLILNLLILSEVTQTLRQEKSQSYWQYRHCRSQFPCIFSAFGWFSPRSFGRKSNQARVSSFMWGNSGNDNGRL